MREWLAKNPAIAAGIAMAALAVAMLVLMVSMRSPRLGPSDEIYYIDLTTLEWFSARHAPTPPPSPAGNASARAFLFGCGGCGDPDNLVLGWVEHVLSDAEMDAHALSDAEAEIVSRDGREWVPSMGARGDQIRQAPSCPNGARAELCRPDGR